MKNEIVSFSNPFDADSDIKTKLFRELQEKLSVNVADSVSYKYDSTGLDVLLSYLELEVEHLLSLRPPKVDIDSDVIYVDLDLNPSGDGSTWDKALPTLGAAMDKYRDLFVKDRKTRQVWVASRGTAQVRYGASVYAKDNTSDTGYRFELIFPGMKIYGGFLGGETSISQRIAGNETLANTSFRFRNIQESGYEYDNHRMSYTDEHTRDVWGDFPELSQWADNPIVVDGFRFDYDTFYSYFDSLPFFAEKYGSENGVINNCIFDYGQSFTRSLNLGTESVIAFNHRVQIIDLAGAHNVSNCKFIGYNIDWTITRIGSNSLYVSGQTFLIESLVNAPQSTFRSCEFKDFNLDLTGTSGDNGTFAYNAGLNATEFQLYPIIQADKVLTCTFTNVTLSHNAYSCNGGHAHASVDQPYPSSNSAFSSGFNYYFIGSVSYDYSDNHVLTTTVTENDTMSTIQASGTNEGKDGANGGNSQYGTSGNGGNAGLPEPSQRLFSEPTEPGALIMDMTDGQLTSRKYVLDSSIDYITAGANGAAGGDGGRAGLTVNGKGVSGMGGTRSVGAQPDTSTFSSTAIGYYEPTLSSSPFNAGSARTAPTVLASSAVKGDDGVDGLTNLYYESWAFADFENTWQYFANTFVPSP